MDKIYKKLMRESKRIASSAKTPSFYAEHKGAILASEEIYYNNADVIRCHGMVARQLADNLGHGVEHAEKVTIDAGGIVFVEGERLFLGLDQIKEAIVIAQLAGLLHDIKRKEPNHAKASAKEAEVILRKFSLKKEEKEIIVQAISNHEAFIEPEEVLSSMGQMISNSLYDADKFRWGIDNFTETLWYMADFRKATVESIVKNFPKGVASIKRIKETFRTATGKKYGPEFIDLGLEVGEKVYEHLRSYISCQRSIIT